jgi:MFS transporter, PPP family, 3-phenylpropionic acid transporter
MRSLKLHSFLGYAVLGAFSPFFPEFLRSARQLDAAQIGTVYAVAQVSVLFAPTLLTLLADRGIHPRIIAGGIYLAAAVTLLALHLTGGFTATLACYTAFSFAYAAMFPSQDGLYFAVQQQRAAAGLATPPYHRVRLFGTIGYMVPSGILLLLIRPGASLSVMLPAAALIALVGLTVATTLPGPRPDTIAPRSPAGRVPTLEAARVLFSRRALLFCAAAALVQIPHAAFGTFFPVHLSQHLGLEPRWLGMVSTFGVVVEAVMMLAFGWFCARLGPARMFAIGAAATALRLVIIALAPSAVIAVTSNLLHGTVILGTMIAPVVFLNRLAGDSFRNSIQGVFAVTVLGPCRIAGNLLCGWLAQTDTRLAFWAGAALAAVASALVFALVKDPPAGERL